MLDASVDQIRSASADARSFDRGRIVRAADVWDNNTFPLFHAVTALTGRGRERRARTGLAWMAGLGKARREWMIASAPRSGVDIERLLPPSAPDLAARDFLDHVRPRYDRLTAETAAELAVDYDLTSSQVRSLRVERAGDRLTGSVTLDLLRRFDVPDGHGGLRAQLHLSWEDLDRFGFDSGDAVGARITGGAVAAVELGGGGGLLSGSSPSVWLQDPAWHLSAAGRRADLVEPRRKPDARPDEPPIGLGRLPAGAGIAATLLHRAMLEIRSVRYARSAPRVPLQDFCRAFEGAGTELLAAARSRAFGSLVEGCARERRWRRGSPRRRRLRPAVWAETAVAPTVPGLGPRRGELRFVSFARDRAETGAVELLYATPSGDGRPWRLRSWRGPAPARFRLRAEAFRREG